MSHPRRTSSVGIAVGALMLVLGGCSGVDSQGNGGGSKDEGARLPGDRQSSLGPENEAEGSMTITREFFGMHDGRLGYGGVPGVPVGAVRLWDSGTTWPQIESSPGGYNWGVLDAAVEAAGELGARPLLVLGQTPSFHAEDPSAEGLHSLGSSSMPKLEPWRRYVTAAAERYGNQVDYQVWNEPNVVGFWSGSTAQMAQLTAEVDRIVTEVVGEDATVVAPSFPLRLPTQREWFAEYWAEEVEGVSVAEHVDVVALNLYPLPDQGPEDTLPLLKFARDHLPAGAGSLPIWDTEINYGLPRGGAAPEPIDDELQRAFVMRTYLLSAAQGLSRVFWYRWDIGVIANTMIAQGDHETPTLAGEGYAMLQDWLLGTEFQDCVPPDGEGGAYRCTAARDDGVRIFYWSPNGDPVVIRTPEATTSWTDAEGTTTPRKGSFDLEVGGSPVMIEASV